MFEASARGLNPFEVNSAKGSHQRCMALGGMSGSRVPTHRGKCKEYYSSRLTVA